MLRAVAVAFASLWLSACSDGSAGNEVAMVPGRRFDPATIAVQSGTTVTWLSKSDDAHTVTAYDASLEEGGDYFSSGGFLSEAEARVNLSAALIAPGESYEVTFEEPGAYRYFCIPHEGDGMKGTVVVEE